MNEIVFDASVMLAMIQHERGTEQVTDEILDRLGRTRFPP